MNPLTWPMAWIEALSPEQAVAELERGRSRVGATVLKAGGVDLLDRMKEGIDNPARIVNLRNVKGHGIEELRELPAGASAAEPPRLRLGALLSLARIAAEPLIQKHVPALAAAARGAATPQVRELATLGGNLLQRPRCWYLRSLSHPCKKKGGTVCFAQEGENDFHALFDNAICAAVSPSALAVPLSALAAVAQVLGPGGTRQLPLEDLFLSPSAPGANLQRDHRLGPEEVLLSVEVPLPGPAERSAYLKVEQKQSFDWPLAEVAVALRRGAGARPVEDARIVLGAAAPTPLRARAAEKELMGLGRLDAAGLGRVAQAALSGAQPLHKNGYKEALFAELVRRAVGLALQPGDEVRP